MTEVEWSDQYRAIIRLLRLRAGLSFPAELRDGVEQAIGQMMDKSGCSTAADYLKLLKDDATAMDDLLVATTLDESSFFRDFGQFRIIADLILPDIRRRRGPGHTIRLWSAGCASGEEAYSLAMMLHRSGALSQASILGTDISREALERARRAVYRECSLQDEGLKMAKPYLTHKGGQYHVNATMKKSVRFDYLNLALDNYPSMRTGTRGIDLIFCRNVLQYYDQQTIHSVVGRLFRSLAEGGWLIIAPSDPPIHEYDMFDFIPTEHGLAYRKANPTYRDQMMADPQASGIEDVRTFGAVDASDTPPDATQPTPQVAPQVASRPTRRATPRTAKPLRKQRLADAKRALADGDYQRAADLTTDLRGEGSIIHIKALAGIDSKAAAKACQAATSKRPLSQELHYLNAVVMMDMKRHREAAESLRRVLFLDDTLALAHFSLGKALRKLGDVEGAVRAFRSTVEICDRSPPDQHVPLGSGETAGKLCELAKTQLEAIE